MYYFKPINIARPRTPWMAVSTEASEGKTGHTVTSLSFTSTPGEVIRTIKKKINWSDTNHKEKNKLAGIPLVAIGCRHHQDRVEFDDPRRAQRPNGGEGDE